LQEVFGGYAAGIRWQRTFGAVLPNDVDPTPEHILAKWKEITTFGQSAAKDL
jgi:multifunctional beta-oxidation protein